MCTLLDSDNKLVVVIGKINLWKKLIHKRAQIPFNAFYSWIASFLLVRFFFSFCCSSCVILQKAKPNSISNSVANEILLSQYLSVSRLLSHVFAPHNRFHCCECTECSFWVSVSAVHRCNINCGLNRALMHKNERSDAKTRAWTTHECERAQIDLIEQRFVLWQQHTHISEISRGVRRVGEKKREKENARAFSERFSF